MIQRDTTNKTFVLATIPLRTIQISVWVREIDLDREGSGKDDD